MDDYSLKPQDSIVSLELLDREWYVPDRFVDAAFTNVSAAQCAMSTRCIACKSITAAKVVCVSLDGSSISVINVCVEDQSSSFELGCLLPADLMWLKIWYPHTIRGDLVVPFSGQMTVSVLQAKEFGCVKITAVEFVRVEDDKIGKEYDSKENLLLFVAHTNGVLVCNICTDGNSKSEKEASFKLFVVASIRFPSSAGFLTMRIAPLTITPSLAVQPGAVLSAAHEQTSAHSSTKCSIEGVYFFSQYGEILKLPRSAVKAFSRRAQEVAQGIVPSLTSCDSAIPDTAGLLPLCVTFGERESASFCASLTESFKDAQLIRLSAPRGGEIGKMTDVAVGIPSSAEADPMSIFDGLSTNPIVVFVVSSVRDDMRIFSNLTRYTLLDHLEKRNNDFRHHTFKIAKTIFRVAHSGRKESKSDTGFQNCALIVPADGVILLDPRKGITDFAPFVCAVLDPSCSTIACYSESCGRIYVFDICDGFFLTRIVKGVRAARHCQWVYPRCVDGPEKIFGRALIVILHPLRLAVEIQNPVFNERVAAKHIRGVAGGSPKSVRTPRGTNCRAVLIRMDTTSIVSCPGWIAVLTETPEGHTALSFLRVLRR